MATTFQGRLKEAVDFLRREVGTPPQILVNLSGGLKGFCDALTNVQQIAANKVPHFPKPTAEGHKGEIIFGDYQGNRIGVSLGRSHFYEGRTMQEITFPLHALRTFGAKTLIITNAAGGVNPSFEPGELMVIRDHINLMGDNPLRGIANKSKLQFVDMTDAYSQALQLVAHEVAMKAKLRLREGVYLATTGPSYETPAEIRAFRHFGVDAVGMSTIPDVIVANYHRMQVLGISCIANMAADLHAGGMNHAEVLRAVKASEPRLVRLLLGVVERIGRNGNSSSGTSANAA